MPGVVRSLVVIGILAILTACMGGGMVGGMGDQRPPEPITVVEVQPVGTGSVRDELVTHATLEAERQADLFAATTGTVLSVTVDEGDPVTRGQVLATIEATALGAGAERANADLAKLSRDLDRLVGLHARGAVSDVELQEAEHAVRTARSASREATATFGNSRIDAPFDGVVALRDLRVGATASPSQRAFQVVDLSSLRLVASIPERDAARVRLGQIVRLVSAYDEGSVATARVERISPVVDATTGTLRVTVLADSGQTSIRPGQFVAVRVEVDRHDGVLVVPRDAVVYEDGKPIVYRMGEADPPEEDPKEEPEAKGGWFSWGAEPEHDVEASATPKSVARRTPVRLGLVDQEHAEVLEGLTAGDALIVVGQTNLRDGAPVRTPEMAREAAEAEARQKAEGDDGSQG